MAYKQPRVPAYPQDGQLGEYIRELILFLKDFCMETWRQIGRMKEAQERCAGVTLRGEQMTLTGTTAQDGMSSVFLIPTAGRIRTPAQARLTGTQAPVILCGGAAEDALSAQVVAAGDAYVIVSLAHGAMQGGAHCTVSAAQDTALEITGAG